MGRSVLISQRRRSSRFSKQCLSVLPELFEGSSEVVERSLSVSCVATNLRTLRQPGFFLKNHAFGPGDMIPDGEFLWRSHAPDCASPRPRSLADFLEQLANLLRIGNTARLTGNT